VNTMDDDTTGTYAVPDSRAARLLRLSGMTGGVVASALAAGARQLAQGQRPRLADMVLTPATAQRVARDLGQLRGAAMKMGQLLSMDTGVVFPPEMTAILAALRADAPPMPPVQLRTVLTAEWGANWHQRFARFDVRAFAAASIGQVHRARTRDGRDLAVKVQYPGVRASIDSDIANVAALLRLPGLLPRELDLSPMLAEARRSLHLEADYRTEASNLSRFHALLAADDRFALPDLHSDLTTENVLAMSFMESVPVDSLTNAPQDQRDHVAGVLIDLVLRELFDFRLMQTDPNLANYRFDVATGRIVLLDFGAVLPIAPDLSERFRALLRATLRGGADDVRAAMLGVGYFDTATKAAHQATIQRMFDMAMAPCWMEGAFDFGASDLPAQVRDAGLVLGGERDLTHLPPPETMFIHRKIGGIYLLAAKLRARIALRPMLERYCD
jgi:predicted unusual protein kinase regulating ubiquinone biosynthesis (AarF/ABC1/UbiB family)